MRTDTESWYAATGPNANPYDPSKQGPWSVGTGVASAAPIVAPVSAPNANPYDTSNAGPWSTGTGVSTAVAPVHPYVAPAAPSAPAATVGDYTGSSTIPAATAGPSYDPFADQVRSMLEASPIYKQGVEAAQRAYDLQNTYAHNITGLQNTQSAAQSAEAARVEPLKEKQIRETLGGRGIINSGQTGLELGEAQHSYETFLRDLKYQDDMRQQSEILGQGQRDQGLADARYQALMSAANWYKDLWWDPTTGVYRGPNAVAATAPAATGAGGAAAPAPASTPAPAPSASNYVAPGVWQGYQNTAPGYAAPAAKPKPAATPYVAPGVWQGYRNTRY